MTIPGRAGSTTNVGEVGLVITFSSAPGKMGGTGETDGTSLIDIIGSEMGSMTTVPSISAPLAGSGCVIRGQVVIQSIQLSSIRRGRSAYFTPGSLRKMGGLS